MANNTLLASDNFASGSLAAGWSAVSGEVTGQVVNVPPHAVEPPALSTGGDQIWTGTAFPADQISEVTTTVTSESGTFVVLWLRFQTNAYSGYQVNITNGACTVLQYTAGTATQIGTTVTGLTFAADDIWTACIAGSCISVYHNFNRIFFDYDTTWTSGAPGFGVYSSVNITHSRVFEWRGYSAVQQDGIWQKQGIVIAPTSSDTLTGGIGTWINSSILYEANAQILSGKVYKTLFSQGNNIGYAESYDGKIWSVYSSAILTGYTVPMWMKVGSTYYLYAQPSPPSGVSDFVAFTSTDGVTYTSQGDTGIGKGTSGAWDSAFVYSLQPVAIINGTWYAFYTGGDNATTYTGSLGLATSSDGLTWTKYGSNPLVTNFWNSQAIVEVNSTWYMWGEVNSPGRGNATNPGLDPTETVRMQSTDLIHWINPIHSLHNSQMFESLNISSGQAFPNAIINIGGKAYFYYTADPSDATSPMSIKSGWQ